MPWLNSCHNSALMRWPFGETSPHKFVVFLVRSNPNPFNAVINFVSQGAIMVAHANRKSFAATAEFF